VDSPAHAGGFATAGRQNLGDQGLKRGVGLHGRARRPRRLSYDPTTGTYSSKGQAADGKNDGVMSVSLENFMQYFTYYTSLAPKK
jgi:hypothetical protein